MALTYLSPRPFRCWKGLFCTTSHLKGGREEREWFDYDSPIVEKEMQVGGNQ